MSFIVQTASRQQSGHCLKAKRLKLRQYVESLRKPANFKLAVRFGCVENHTTYYTSLRNVLWICLHVAVFNILESYELPRPSTMKKDLKINGCDSYVSGHHRELNVDSKSTSEL